MGKLEQIGENREYSVVHDSATELVNDPRKSFQELQLLLVLIVADLFEILNGQDDRVVDPLARL